MNQPTPTPAAPSATPPAPPRWTAEKTVWWIVFGVLVLSIVAMLGLWN
jgi:hypothetical protein